MKTAAPGQVDEHRCISLSMRIIYPVAAVMFKSTKGRYLLVAGGAGMLIIDGKPLIIK